MKIVRIIILIVALFGLIQLVPYGRNHLNPPVVQEPAWADVETRAIAQRACFDCHSNETVWPWYTNVAPSSWLVQHDVEEGRSKVNFSEWGRGEQETDEIANVIQGGEMPPPQYTLIHADARLSASEKEAFLRGLSAMGITSGEAEGQEDD